MNLERRNKQRIQFDEPVEYQLKDPRFFGGCLSSDLSETGVKIFLNDFMPLHSELVLRLPLLDGKVVDCMGRIVWIEKLAHMDRFQAGIEFEDIDSLGQSQSEIGKIVQSKNI